MTERSLGSNRCRADFSKNQQKRKQYFSKEKRELEEQRSISQEGLNCRRHSPEKRGKCNHSKLRILSALKSWTEWLLASCLNWISVLVINYQDQRQLREQSVSIHSLVHHEGKLEQELNSGTQRQKLIQKPSKHASYWLAPYGLLNLLSDTNQDHLPRGWHCPPVGTGLIYERYFLS